MYASNTFQLLSDSYFLNYFLNQPHHPMHEPQKIVLSSAATILYLFPIVIRVLIPHFSLIHTRVTDSMFPQGSCLHPPYLYDYIALYL